MGNMIVCGASRLLLVGFVIGTAVSTITGSDLAGWAAAALSVGVYVVVQRLRGTTGSCALPSPDVETAASVGRRHTR